MSAGLARGLLHSLRGGDRYQGRGHVGAIGRYKYPPYVFEGFEDGPWGDPQNADAEVGERSYALINDWVCAEVRSEWRMWNS